MDQWIQLVRLGLEAGWLDRPTDRLFDAPLRKGPGGLPSLPRTRVRVSHPGEPSETAATRSPSTSARGAVNNGTLAGEKKVRQVITICQGAVFLRTSGPGQWQHRPRFSGSGTIGRMDRAERDLDAASPLCRCSSYARKPSSIEDFGGVRVSQKDYQLQVCGRDRVLFSLSRCLA